MLLFMLDDAHTHIHTHCIFYYSSLFILPPPPLPLKVLFCFVTFLALFNMSGAGGAQFLGIQRRFRDSSYYDSYYCCNICGGHLLWVFDGTDILLHWLSQSNVGNVEVQAVNSSSRFSSMILSHRGSGSEACIDVVIIATQTNPEWRPRVICHSLYQDHIVEYDSSLIDPIYEDHNSSVALTYSIMQPNIVPARTDTFITHFLVCRSFDDHITWTFNGSSVIFNGRAKPGSNGLKLYPEDSTTALFEAIVLEKTPNGITSVLVATILEPWHLYLHGKISCSNSLDQTLSFPINILSSIDQGNKGTNVTEDPYLAPSCKYAFYL